MEFLEVTEYERIPRTDENHKFLSRLQRFDEGRCASGGERVFDWNDCRFVRAKNFVGVIAVPEGVVEILPKIDKSGSQKDRAQHNLLYMLSITRKIVGEERDLASVGTQRMSLLEQVIAVFASRTLSELKKGIDHCYVSHEENIRCLKGKLVLREQITRNAVHRERAFCRYDDFISDTPINRIIKASCRRLLSLSKVGLTQKTLREVIFSLDEVTDLEVEEHHFSGIHYSRNTERFRLLIDFSLMVLKGISPSWSVGKDVTFSLLFPMEELFEEFIARYIYRHADYYQIARHHVHVQAVGFRKWLLRRDDDSGAFRLKPDLIIVNPDGTPKLILDTKWKHLLSDQEDRKNGVSQGDIYQLYAYAHRYGCQDNVLLFPSVGGVSPKSYFIEGNKQNHQIRIEFLMLNRDLRKDWKEFRRDLFRILKPGVEVPEG